MARDLDAFLAQLAHGPAAPVYLVTGDLVLAEPAAERLARALADRAGCELETRRHPPALAAILDDLRTYSLFASAKVVLAVDTAVLADKNAAADLVDDAEAGLPLSGGDLSPRERRAASRLLQALRLFGVDPARGGPEEVLDRLPEWAFSGGAAFRGRRQGRGRGKRQVEELREGLTALLAAAREAALVGFAEGDLAELAAVVTGGLPPGYSLVLAERSAAADHPVVATLAGRGLTFAAGGVQSERGGGWQGVELLVEELARQTGVGLAADAVDELARRTLRQAADRGGGIDAESSARFAAEYRKLAGLAGEGGTITRRAVEETVADRGEQDVWQLLDAIGEGRAGEALDRLDRLLAGAADPLAARLSFFSLFAGFCRQIAAVRGLMDLVGAPPGERSYPRFKDRWAPAFQAELPTGGKSPVAGLHPFRLHKSYLAASRLSAATAEALPWRVLETELRIKGESGDPDTALADLVAHLAGGGTGARPAPARSPTSRSGR